MLRRKWQIHVISVIFIICFFFFWFFILPFGVWIVGEVDVFLRDETPENLWFNSQFNFLKTDKTENGKEKKKRNGFSVITTEAAHFLLEA